MAISPLQSILNLAKGIADKGNTPDVYAKLQVVNNFSPPSISFGTSTPNLTQTSTPQFNTGGTIQSAIKTAVTPRQEPVDYRRAFETTPIQTKAPPIITGAGTLGNWALEAIPRALATVYGELGAPDRKTGQVNIGIDARRLGFNDPKYITATKEIHDRINAGESPLAVALEVGSMKTLDVAFGASLIASALRRSTSLLLRGGVQERLKEQAVLN